MVTIKQIAQEAGVSKSTVSRYLNQGYVSHETAQKIATIVKKYNYVPNSFARNLKSEKSTYVGVVIPRMDSPAVMEMLDGIDQDLRDRGLQILIANTDLVVKREIESMYHLIQNNVAGIIALTAQITKEHCRVAKRFPVPIVFVGQSSDHVYTVNHDNFLAGQQLVEEILPYNHKKIMYLGVSERDVSVGIERRNGVVETYGEAGIAVEEVKTTFRMKDVYNLGTRLLKKETATLYIAATDQIATGLYHACNDLGIKIGQDVSIASFGGYGMSSHLFPLLTTVDLQHHLVGKKAADFLCQRMGLKKSPQQIEIETSVRMGRSVGIVV